eukprot:6987795-Alexandrium_andersonii.AAC.1
MLEDAQLDGDRAEEGLNGSVELLEGPQYGSEGDARHVCRQVPAVDASADRQEAELLQPGGKELAEDIG